MIFIWGCAKRLAGRTGGGTPIQALTTTDERVIDMAKSGVSRSSSKYKNLTGQRFGRLNVLRDVGRSRSGKVVWSVRCDCGTEKTVVTGDLTSGRTTSCGCFIREITSQRNETHGMSSTPEYRTWASMVARCRYESATGYEDYGGRGISVCAEWEHSFEAFYQDMGPRPSPGHSLDRYPDVNGNYEPNNVRWASASDQARNKRTTVFATIGDDTRPLIEWCEIRGLKYSAVQDRMHKLGWSVEEALGLVRRFGKDADQLDLLDDRRGAA